MVFRVGAQVFRDPSGIGVPLGIDMEHKRFMLEI